MIYVNCHLSREGYKDYVETQVPHFQVPIDIKELEERAIENIVTDFAFSGLKVDPSDFALVAYRRVQYATV